MLEHAREAVQFVQGRTRADLDQDRKLNLALVRLIEIVGEAASRVSDECRREHSKIDWQRVIAMRHRLAHGYDEIDFDILWDTIQIDLPPLIERLEQALREKS